MPIALLRVAAMALVLIALLPPHYLSKLSGRRSPWPRRFLGLVGRLAGMRASVTGKPQTARVLFVANHLSWLDILILAGASGAAFVSRADVARWPLVGWLASLNDTIYVERADRGAVRGQADAVRAALAKGQPVALFPEGTTEGGGHVLPFRPSLLAALFPPLPGVMVQPVAIDYGAAAPEIAWIGDESALANAIRMLSRARSTPVAIRFLDPIDPAQSGDRKALAALSRDRIVDALGASAPQNDPL